MTSPTPPPRHLQLADKADHLRKGASTAEASKRVAGATRALQDARAEWSAAGAALCD